MCRQIPEIVKQFNIHIYTETSMPQNNSNLKNTQWSMQHTRNYEEHHTFAYSSYQYDSETLYISKTFFRPEANRLDMWVRRRASDADCS